MAMRDGEETEARLARADLSEMRVEPLDQAQAAALLDRHAPDLRPDLRARVLAEAAGNPLGLVELAVVATRLGEDALLPAWLPLTTRLEQTFGAAVAELPAPTRSLLRVAALNDGDRLDEILAAGSVSADEPVTSSTLEPAVLARLLDIDSTYHVRFRHPLVRSSVRQRTGLVQRRQVHAALAQVLRDPDRRAWHRAAATIGPDEKVAAELTAVAVRMRRRGVLATTVAALERAAQLSPRPADRAGRLLDAAETAYEADDHETFQRLVRAVAEPDLPTADRARLQWIQEVARGGWSGGTRLVVHTEIAERMRLDGDTDRALQALCLIALRCWWSNPDQATREAVVAVAERLDADPHDPRLVHILALGAPVERGAVVLERLSLLMTRVDLDPERLFQLGIAATGLGAPGEAAVFLSASVAGLRDQGQLGLLAQALSSQAWTAAQLGDTILGMTAATEGNRLAAEIGQVRTVLITDLMRAQIEALCGNGEAARTLAHQGERTLLAIGAFPMLAMVQQVRGIDALGGGRYEEAYAHLARITDPTDPAYHAYVRFFVVAHLAESGTRCGRRGDVHRVVTELEPIAAVTGFPALNAGLAYARALIAPDDAAESLFRSGIATFDALGTTPWAERARQELRASGETVRRTLDARGTLTPQEQQIARLVAEGLPNREIATRLFLSSRTVGSHLYRIYPKLGVSSRAELARVMTAPGGRP
ncbi:helix-turn-helix transcriptional regulator [Nonomuraea sp. NPDC050643]|uniref:helix-turn-helix transcriptional regulator n=1 Tax=Nonomuraea sp. NPDC050643 TaxID=3155660 RepID=UPI0033F94FC3